MATNSEIISFVKSLLDRLCENYDRSIGEIEKEVEARCTQFGREVTGREVMIELIRIVKGEGEGSCSDPRIDEMRRTALRFCAHLQNGKNVIIPLKQIEGLVDRCIQPIVRCVKKKLVESREVELARKMLPSLEKLGKCNENVAHSTKYRRGLKMVQKMSKQKPSSKSRRTERRADIAQVTMYQNQRRGEGGPLDADDLSPQFGGISQVRRPRSASSTGNEVTQIINNIPRPPIVPLPPPIPPPLIIDASSKALETILPSSKTDSWQPNTSLSNSRILDARPAQTYTSASPGKDARYDACRFARDLCNYICIPHNATAASFYYFHFFMAHGVLEPEPPSTVLDAIMAAQVFLESKLKKIMDKKDFEQKNTHWFTLLSNGEFVDENDTSPIPVGLLRASAEVYMGALPPDELCALAVAAVYLGAKSCDVPHRISTLLEAARRSAIKRKWPPALPWRDHILLAEHRLLKALNFDLRVDDAKVLLEQICPDTPTAECYLYANESKGTQNISTLDMPPPDQPPKNPKCLDPRLKEDTIEKVIYTPAFEASGIVLEHEPKELIAASVFCVWNYISKNLSPAKKSADTIIKDAWLNSIFPVKQTTASPTKKRLMNPNEIKIKGIIGELDATNSDLRIRFSAEAIRTRFEERYDAISIRKARYDTALRAANNAKARLADDEIGRFVVRRCQDHIPPSTKPIAKKQLTSDQLHNNIPVDLSNRAVAESLIENPIATRRRRDDECGVLLYIGDDPSLIGMARRNGFILNLLVFPFRCDDAHFRRLVFETSEKNLYQPPRIENMGNKIVVPAVEPEFGGDDDDGATEERASSLPRHFVPILHIFWPLADIEALKLSRRAMEDVKNRTRDLANSLRAEYDSLRAENKVHFENTASTQVAKVQVDKSDSVVIMKSPNGNKTNGDSHSTSLRMETSSLPSLSNSVPNEADTRAVSSNTGEQRNRSDSNGWNGRHFSQRDDYRSRPSQEMSNNYARHYDARNNAYDQSRGRQSTNTPPDFEARRRSLSRDYRPESNSHLGYYRGDQPVYSNDRAYRPDNHVLHRTDRAPYYRRDMPYHSSPRDDQGRGYRQGMPYRSSPRDDQRRGYRQDMPYHSPPRDDQRRGYRQDKPYHSPPRDDQQRRQSVHSRPSNTLNTQALFANIDRQARADFNAIADYATREKIIDKFKAVKANLGNPSRWLSVTCRSHTAVRKAESNGGASPPKKRYRFAEV